jgi:hypothetical protein
MSSDKKATSSTDKVTLALETIQEAIAALKEDVEVLKESTTKMETRANDSDVRLEGVEKNAACTNQILYEKDIVVSDLIPSVHPNHYVNFFIRQFKLETVEINNVFSFKKRGFEGRKKFAFFSSIIIYYL